MLTVQLTGGLLPALLPEDVQVRLWHEERLIHDVLGDVLDEGLANGLGRHERVADFIRRPLPGPALPRAWERLLGSERVGPMRPQDTPPDQPLDQLDRAQLWPRLQQMTVQDFLVALPPIVRRTLEALGLVDRVAEEVQRMEQAAAAAAGQDAAAAAAVVPDAVAAGAAQGGDAQSPLPPPPLPAAPSLLEMLGFIREAIDVPDGDNETTVAHAAALVGVHDDGGGLLQLATNVYEALARGIEEAPQIPPLVAPAPVAPADAPTVEPAQPEEAVDPGAVDPGAAGEGPQAAVSEEAAGPWCRSATCQCCGGSCFDQPQAVPRLLPRGQDVGRLQLHVLPELPRPLLLHLLTHRL